ncbi:MAG: hypothetical protein H6745_30240 [Deltaproteobacteria bacterium]|nr:hypothetical protein [Deltaproteobacteria bacterium]
MIALAACAGDSGDAATDTAGPSDADVAAVGCSEGDPDACDYPSRGLTFTVRQGYSVEDPVTGRSLPILARVPEGPGPFPVIVWSHGGGFLAAGQLQGVEWGTLLASHGFVVIHVAHVPPTADTGLAACELAEVPAGECLPSSGDEDANGLIALIKTLDLSAVLAKLPALSAWSVDNGGPAMDLEHVAVAGWSAGSRGPTVLRGAEIFPSPGAPRFTRPIAPIAAVMMLSPTGPGFGGYFDDGAGDTSWDALLAPTLMITGANDVKPTKPGLNGPVRRVGFDAQPADGDRFLLYSDLPVGVGGHPTFNLEDAASSDARLVRLSRAISATALAYFDAELRDDAAARAWLATDNARVLAGDASWESR